MGRYDTVAPAAWRNDGRTIAIPTVAPARRYAAGRLSSRPSRGVRWLDPPGRAAL